MKKLLIILCMFTVAEVILAHKPLSCSSGNISIVAPYYTLNKNPVLIVAFYGYCQDMIKDSKCPVYLKSRSNKIPLVVKEILKGDFKISEVVFTTGAQLTAGEEYELVVEGKKDYRFRFWRYNKQLEKTEDIKLTANSNPDNTAPVFAAVPKYISGSVIRYGCGHAEWAYFTMDAKDESEVLVKAQVKNLLTGNTTEYIVPIENGKVQVGHDMCSGGFLFKDADEYEVCFTLMDMSGNCSVVSKPIKFRKPV
ncbi:MAG: hypothetical protein QM737_21730 [Ferruginibacter sp.]